MRSQDTTASFIRPYAALCAIAFITFTLASREAEAWGALGHEVAGEIAAGNLDPGPANRVRELLAGESMARASTWADRMRSDPSPFWQDEAGPYHYATVPPGTSYEQIGPPPEGDAISALEMFRRELRDPQTSLARQRLALRFAIHIIQDLQQPLHVGNGQDRGGNDVRVTVLGDDSNLHRVWDVYILESAGRSRREWVRHLSSSSIFAEYQPSDPLEWVAESAELRETLYPVPRKIDKPYFQAHLEAAERRLTLAGLRTASWLNETFAEDAGEAPADGPPPKPEKRWWERWFGG